MYKIKNSISEMSSELLLETILKETDLLVKERRNKERWDYIGELAKEADKRQKQGDKVLAKVSQ